MLLALDFSYPAQIEVPAALYCLKDFLIRHLGTGADLQPCEKLPWANTSAIHSYKALPPLEDFEQLLADYARYFEEN